MSKKSITCAACGYHGEYKSWNELTLKGYYMQYCKGDKVILLICPRCSTVRSPQDPLIKEMDHD